jgi:hypothetical protein
MSRITKMLLTVIIAVAGCIATQAEADTQKGRVRCGVGHRIRILELDVSPDPIARGQKIEKLRAVVQLDGIGECDTLFELREESGDDVIAQGMKKALRPGRNHIEFRPIVHYRFRAVEHCFRVFADIAGTRRPVDSARRFCAREISRQGRRWSMRATDRALAR